MHVNLLGQRATNIQLKTNVNGDQTLELEMHYNFSVSYSADNRQCEAVITTDVRTKDDPDKLYISVKIEGLFACEGVQDVETKKQAHVLAYTLLFPYAQILISNLATSAGLPGIMIGMAPMDPDSIVIPEQE